MKEQNNKHKDAKSMGEKLKTNSLIFIFSFFSRDLQDFKF